MGVSTADSLSISYYDGWERHNTAEPVVIVAYEIKTADQVAELLQVSRDQVSRDVVYRLANDGDLVGRKIGRAWRFPRQAVEEYAWDRSTDSCSSTRAEEDGAESASASVAKVNARTVVRLAKPKGSPAKTACSPH